MKTSTLLPRLAVGLTSAIAVSVVAPIPEAHATGLWSYDLLNHPDGSLASPYYGLRLDDLMDLGDNYTFDFEHADSSLTLDYDMDAMTIRIYGQAYGGVDSGNGYAAGSEGIASIDFTYNNVQAGTGSTKAFVKGNGEDAGFGTLGFDFLDDDLTDRTFELAARSRDANLATDETPDSVAFRLKYGHRDLEGLSGFGWLFSRETTDGEGAWSDTKSKDWLFEAEKVPEPGMILGLFSIGALFVGRRKRTNQA